jgi:hypothetical protein
MGQANMTSKTLKGNNIVLNHTNLKDQSIPHKMHQKYIL